MTANANRVEAVRIEKDAQLHMFGVDSTSQPTPTRFPKTFNPANHKIWLKVLEDEAYQRFLAGNPPAQKRWEYVIKAYLRACSTANVYPFAGRTDFEDLAKSFLKSARTILVNWFKDSGIFNVVKIQRVERKHSFTHQNFCIEVTATLKPISDPTFDAWLVKHPMPGFRKEDGIFRKSLRAHLDVEYSMRDGQPCLTYRIFCHTPIRSIDPSLMDHTKLTKYVDTKMWDPMIRELRIDGLGNRLF